MYDQLFRDEFARRFEKSEGCWEWRRGKDGSGYGKMPFGGKSLKAHRVAYEISVGPIPFGAHILHSCDNPACVRPDHLRAGTHQENMADKTAKRRARGAAPGSSNGAKLSESQVLAIHGDPRPYDVIAARYGVSTAAIGDIKTGRTWKRITCAQRSSYRLGKDERAQYMARIDELEKQVASLSARF